MCFDILSMQYIYTIQTVMQIQAMWHKLDFIASHTTNGNTRLGGMFKLSDSVY